MQDLALCSYGVLEDEDVVRFDVDDAARSGRDETQLLPATSSAAHKDKISYRKFNCMHVGTLDMRNYLETARGRYESGNVSVHFIQNLLRLTDVHKPPCVQHVLRSCCLVLRCGNRSQKWTDRNMACKNIQRRTMYTGRSASEMAHAPDWGVIEYAAITP